MLTARIWRERGRRYRNEAARCCRCSKVHYPPLSVCTACGSRELEAVTMAETGRVITHTAIHVAPPEFASHVPYVVAVLEMDDGARLMAQVADVEPADVTSGMRVRLEFRKIREEGRSGLICYGHKAVPA